MYPLKKFHVIYDRKQGKKNNATLYWSNREICVNEKYDDPDMEHVRQWLLANGAEETDEYVFVSICW